MDRYSLAGNSSLNGKYTTNIQLNTYFRYSFSTFKHNNPNIVWTWTSELPSTRKNSSSLGFSTKHVGKRSFLSLTNLGHSIKTWYSLSITLHISHFLSPLGILLRPHLPDSILYLCELSLILVIAFLKALLC